MNSLLVRSAASYAAVKHKDQMYGDEPYTTHLAHVAEVLFRFNFYDETLQAAAWLHDTVEDTDAKIEEIALMFGDRVADLVYRVTNEQGKNRKERHVKTYPKIAASEDATTLKLADRIANVEKSMQDSYKLYGMYRKEYTDFRNTLYKEGIHAAMWQYLDFLIGREDE
jgi:guanosine-3',5'-bis(diphosphate) 3'-pyrophosphohydrolase